jgi:hypothetical protein
VHERCIGVLPKDPSTVSVVKIRGERGRERMASVVVAGSGTYRAAMAQVLDVRTYNHDVLVGSEVVIGEQGTRKVSIINDESS